MADNRFHVAVVAKPNEEAEDSIEHRGAEEDSDEPHRNGSMSNIPNNKASKYGKLFCCFFTSWFVSFNHLLLIFYKASVTYGFVFLRILFWFIVV